MQSTHTWHFFVASGGEFRVVAQAQEQGGGNFFFLLSFRINSCRRKLSRSVCVSPRRLMLSHFFVITKGKEEEKLLKEPLAKGAFLQCRHLKISTAARMYRHSRARAGKNRQRRRYRIPHFFTPPPFSSQSCRISPPDFHLHFSAVVGPYADSESSSVGSRDALFPPRIFFFGGGERETGSKAEGVK